jgi:hypothetical protein
MASRSGRSWAPWQSSGQLRGRCSRVSVGNPLASALSMALPLLGIAPVAKRGCGRSCELQARGARHPRRRGTPALKWKSSRLGRDAIDRWLRELIAER